MRHTPYVLLRFAADGTSFGQGEQSDEIAPAALHRAILEAIQLGEAEG
jgi:hypothetical protein